MSAKIDAQEVGKIGNVLNDAQKPLTDRFRALFTLKNIGGAEAVDCISRCFEDKSALLKHELAFCLGQMQDAAAMPVLMKVLSDESQEVMVRHEAGEALGAIGSFEAVSILEDYAKSSIPEIAETCQLALKRIAWLQRQQQNETGSSETSKYASVDPAPPCECSDVDTLRKNLLCEDVDLFDRYKAMFRLRNLDNTEAVEALAAGLKCKSALFRHEIAYVLGQMQHPAAISQLSENLHDEGENAMVRHECAEALGAIATEECVEILRQFATDKERVVRESCIVALDMTEYENSEQFEYANGLQQL